MPGDCLSFGIYVPSASSAAGPTMNFRRLRPFPMTSPMPKYWIDPSGALRFCGMIVLLSNCLSSERRSPEYRNKRMIASDT